ncbi:iron-containing alcohol dehydrogenase [Caldicellulosiruptor acetigenus I77R1B]|uniref:Iron-containing alcohol dehydrogenase n=1 Tax=Caldicellulosiruptor acetigenus (strain ATCC 700853 / DSM 12137 / I77R1B) TaxID=632335 RepID=E4S601_CALA7|nr:iron-containing alcohol dehydrogenase [Caldicellulosiruptor acetigenus]ADQ39674.1 iron-containing alcohol dehydrogenase [Caldicellulosiruptor acetigenus I77R1B]
MKTYRFYMPPISLMGRGCLKDVGEEIKALGYKKALIVTDKTLVKIGLVKKVTDILDDANISYVIFDETKPNPTVKNVEDGLKMLKGNNCDFIISIGGGSPHDCAKGIGLVATNGGSIKDYEGVNKACKPMLPLVAINTTAGTGSEVTRFAIITDEDRHVKMAIVDWHVTPLIAVNDPELMIEMPKSLTAATGMDALTHAIEAYLSTDATPVTDASALMAIELIFKYLKKAVENGNDIEAREKMAYAEYLAGVAFNNAGLGYVHAMAHQLGGFYDLPHGVCNAVLLPHVLAYNLKVVPHRFIDIAKAMGIDVQGVSTEKAGEMVIESIKALSKEIGIPSGLKELGVKEEDIRTLAENALKDACGLTNPKQATVEEIIEIYKSAF